MRIAKSLFLGNIAGCRNSSSRIVNPFNLPSSRITPSLNSLGFKLYNDEVLFTLPLLCICCNASGKQCLQLTGGAETSVTLRVATNFKAPSQLKFRAERWTRREPFAFRIEMHSGDGWDEIARL